ncbi:MAG: aquaporin, partial [Clostridia bacterium]|nr:aquaporin [Clostridia bacterium]
VWANGRMTCKEMLLYWVAQCIGAIIAGAVLFGIAKSANMEIGTFAANGYGEAFAGAAGYQQISLWGAFATEAVLTFVFLMVILGVTDGCHENGKLAGLAIGLTLVLIHLISIPLTNTSVNPARSLSQAIFSENACAMPQLWLFIVAPLVGAGLAGLAYKAIMCECKCCKKD